ncbi:MAG: hypothetical protein U5O16_23435 [Rhodococcus sp. (in: high G+C Gram-positive bacteria)]|uniref:hypothetical protein n=1 Tax=Rhodococcus sp. TaxID=1831 RepID=UPI002AD5FE50|nr:hypothetical protein [Rhodococcus sp. (in: high G+C Gram-positive bacteria)]
MSKQPDFFKPLPSEKPLARRNGVAYSRESRERVASFETYRDAIRDLDNKISHLENYSADGLISGWIAVHQRHLENLDTARAAFTGRLHSFTSAEAETPIQRDRHGDPVTGPTPDKLERWPGETPEEHEMRLFTDFAIRIPEGTDFPIDTAFIVPERPDKSLELLTHIRDLLSELVANQARTAVTVGSINTCTVPDAVAAMREYTRGVQYAVQPDTTDNEPTPAPHKPAGASSEIVLTGDPDIGVGISRTGRSALVTLRLQGVTAHIHADTAFTLATQLERTAQALRDGWIPPTPAAGTETPRGDA